MMYIGQLLRRQRPWVVERNAYGIPCARRPRSYAPDIIVGCLVGAAVLVLASLVLR